MALPSRSLVPTSGQGGVAPELYPTADDAPRILLVRRDNIGDLVCTTPLIAGLRRRYPKSWLGVFANSYNAPILRGNPDIDRVFAYRKAKHGGMNVVAVAAERVRLVLGLRRERIGYVLLATPAFQPRSIRFARLIGARSVIGFAAPNDRQPRLDVTVPLAKDPLSEVEDVYRLGAPLGLTDTPGPMRVVPDATLAAAARAAMGLIHIGRGPIIGVHISARKPSQRWSVDRFVGVMRVLQAAYGASFMLFWSPGPEHSPTHPGDDGKAAQIQAMARECRVLPSPTEALEELVAGLSSCDAMLMADGGAMHVAAALGKPIVCLFGQSDATRWRPWGVRHQLLQPASRDVSDVSVADVVAAFDALFHGRA